MALLLAAYTILITPVNGTPFFEQRRWLLWSLGFFFCSKVISKSNFPSRSWRPTIKRPRFLYLRNSKRNVSVLHSDDFQKRLWPAPFPHSRFSCHLRLLRHLCVVARLGEIWIAVAQNTVLKPFDVVKNESKSVVHFFFVIAWSPSVAVVIHILSSSVVSHLVSKVVLQPWIAC